MNTGASEALCFLGRSAGRPWALASLAAARPRAWSVWEVVGLCDGRPAGLSWDDSSSRVEEESSSDALLRPNQMVAWDLSANVWNTRAPCPYLVDKSAPLLRPSGGRPSRINPAWLLLLELFLRSLQVQRTPKTLPHGTRRCCFKMCLNGFRIYYCKHTRKITEVGSSWFIQVHVQASREDSTGKNRSLRRFWSFVVINELGMRRQLMPLEHTCQFGSQVVKSQAIPRCSSFWPTPSLSIHSLQDFHGTSGACCKNKALG